MGYSRDWTGSIGLTFLGAQDFPPRDKTSTDAMPLQIIVCELAVIKRLRICVSKGRHSSAKVLDGIKVLPRP